MRVCFVDEAGCMGMLPTNNRNIQPIIIVAGVSVDASSIHNLTHRLLDFKSTFYRGLNLASNEHWLDGIKTEIKGSDLRKNAAKNSRNKRRHAFGVYDQFFLEF